VDPTVVVPMLIPHVQLGVPVVIYFPLAVMRTERPLATQVAGNVVLPTFPWPEIAVKVLCVVEAEITADVVDKMDMEVWWV